jgi:hypothetical protein
MRLGGMKEIVITLFSVWKIQLKQRLDSTGKQRIGKTRRHDPGLGGQPFACVVALSMVGV